MEQAAHRKRLPEERPGKTHHFTLCRTLPDKSVEVVDCYLTVNPFPDNGMPGEFFLRVAKMGDEAGGALHAMAVAASMALQHGAPVEVVAQKFIGMHFEPNGPSTGEPKIRFASSIPDYVGRYLILKHGSDEARQALGLV